MDLSKEIKINEHYKITYGRLLLVGIISLFMFLGMTAANNWIPPAEAFFLVSNTFLLLERRADKEVELDKLKDKIEKIDKRMSDCEDGNS